MSTSDLETTADDLPLPPPPVLGLLRRGKRKQAIHVYVRKTGVSMIEAERVLEDRATLDHAAVHAVEAAAERALTVCGFPWHRNPHTIWSRIWKGATR